MFLECVCGMVVSFGCNIFSPYRSVLGYSIEATRGQTFCSGCKDVLYIEDAVTVDCAVFVSYNNLWIALVVDVHVVHCCSNLVFQNFH